MGRQSGDFLLGTALFVCVLSAGLSGRMTAFTPATGHSKWLERENEHREFNAGAWLPGSDSACEYHSCPLPAVAHQPARAVLSDLPRGTRIVVGSLDVTGERHVVTLTNAGLGDKSGNVIVPMRFASGAANRHRSHSAAAELPSESTVPNASLPLVADANLQPAVSNAHLRINAPLQRTFLLPHFRNTGVIQEPSACELLNDNSRVRLYLDPRLKETHHVEQLRSQCEWLISAAESQALPITETWIGKISDVDYDDRLTFVITNLDERTIPSNDVAPVHGCIRNVDFQPYSALGGDIVYLDVAILSLPHQEQASLLTHELAHAAVCSIRLERKPGTSDHRLVTRSSSVFCERGRDSNTNISGVAAAGVATSRVAVPHQIPSWLNEAVAHLMELQCIGTADSSASSSGNFQRRIENFLANTACSPIVAAEHVMSPDERRNGSRGAATLFLKPWLTTPESLQRFLDTEAGLDHRMEVLADNSFAEIFRDWTLSMAEVSVKHQPLHTDFVPAGHRQEQFSLLGTAFKCFECPEDFSMIVIESDVAAKLQISIIEPDTRVTLVRSISKFSEAFPKDRNND